MFIEKNIFKLNENYQLTVNSLQGREKYFNYYKIIRQTLSCLKSGLLKTNCPYLKFVVLVVNSLFYYDNFTWENNKKNSYTF